MRWPILLLFLGLSPALASPVDTLQSCQDLAYTTEGSTDCFRQLLTSTSDPRITARAFHGMGDLRRANQAYRIAVRDYPDDADLRSHWGRLYLTTHQAADADRLFHESLSIDANNVAALTGVAELAVQSFDGHAETAIQQVLTIDPANATARLLLAQLQLEAGETDNARLLLEEVLADPVSREATLQSKALLTAADLLDGRDAGERVRSVLDTAPGYGDVYAIPAHYFVITRRYREAVDLLQQAVSVEPGNFDAHAMLGINLMRVNDLAAAREHLENAYNGHPYDPRVVNTLRLLDQLDEYEVHETEHEVVRISQSEAPAVTPYVLEMIARARREMGRRYRYQPTEPIVIELYPHHTDFAVRTDGLPGIGILGAAFGNVVVMNGPTAQHPDDFDWSNALWHELAHIYTLGVTNNLVSRWFSEGVSVYEEWRFGPASRASVSLGFLDAYAKGQLLSIVELEDGFLRPSYENQVEVSYVQSGLVCQFIAETFDDGLVHMLRAYRDGASTAEAIRSGLGTEPDELDALFNTYLENRFGTTLSGLENFREELAAASEALIAEDWRTAIVSAETAISSYPEYVGKQSPYLLLAQAAEESGLDVLQKDALLQFWQRGGRNVAALDALANLLEASRGNEADELLALLSVQARAEPLVPYRHEQLGDLLGRLGQHQTALSEFRTALVLQPYDLAAAHFKVAQTLFRLDQTIQARRELLFALEIAPRYRPALALLLEMNK